MNAKPGLIGEWFSFRGRVNRAAFWLRFALPLIGIQVVGAVLDAALFGTDRHIFYPLALLFTLIPNLGAQVKRLHDRDKSGWFLLISFIPVVGQIWLFIEMVCLRGTVGSNRFGPDPLG